MTILRFAAPGGNCRTGRSLKIDHNYMNIPEIDKIRENAHRVMSPSSLLLALWILVGTGLNGCGSDSDTIESDAFRCTFDEDPEGWTTGVADYPMGASEAEQQAIDEFYELNSAHAGLPDPLDAADGALGCPATTTLTTFSCS